MRRIVAILLGLFVGFWIVYGLFRPFTNIVNDLAIKVVGPAIWGVVIGIGTSPFWISYGSFIMLGTGAVIGFIIYSLWHKADWSIRRWGAARTATDLGTTLTTNTPATPLGATIRPAETPKVLETPKTEQTKTETTPA